MRGQRLLGVQIALAIVAAPAAGQQSVVDSLHNLSATGRGEIRAAVEGEVCIFCHTPHRSEAVQPMWNRESSGLPYKIGRAHV